MGSFWLTVMILLLVIAMARVRSFKQRVAQGFAILRPFRRFLTRVCTWQALSWGFRFASVYFFLEAFQVAATLHKRAARAGRPEPRDALPFTTAGVGTQQGFLVYVFDRAGSGNRGLVAAQLQRRDYIATTLLNVVVGFASLFLMVGTVRWKRLVVPEEKKAYASGRVTTLPPEKRRRPRTAGSDRGLAPVRPGRHRRPAGARG